MKSANWAAPAAAAAGVLLAAFFTVRFIEGPSVFYPMKGAPEPPPGLPAPEDVFIQTADGARLHAWLFGGKPDQPAILFLHGNAGHIGHRREKLQVLALLGAPILIVDYRGYGLSEGRPTEKGLYRDADAAYEELLKRGWPPESIVLYGESIGGAAAIDLAARKPVGAVIVEDTFTSFPAMVRRSMRLIPAWLLSTRMDSLSKIGKVRAPVLILHSRDDEIVPFDMGRALFRAAPEPKRFVELRGGHNTAFLEDAQTYFKGIQDFFSPRPDGVK